jgi:plasmid stability protein
MVQKPDEETELNMQIKVELPADLIEAARVRAAASNISVEHQIEAWVRRGIAVDSTLPEDELQEQDGPDPLDETRSGPT